MNPKGNIVVQERHLANHFAFLCAKWHIYEQTLPEGYMTMINDLREPQYKASHQDWAHRIGTQLASWEDQSRYRYNVLGFQAVRMVE